MTEKELDLMFGILPPNPEYMMKMFYKCLGFGCGNWQLMHPHYDLPHECKKCGGAMIAPTC